MAQLSEVWASQWVALVSAASPFSPDPTFHADLHLLTHTLLDSSCTDNAEVLLDLAQRIEQTLSSARTGIPIDHTQRLGITALIDTLTQQHQSLEEALAHWRSLPTAWLVHPYYTVAALHGLATMPDQSSVLAALIDELHRLPDLTELRVWRCVLDESPMIEIAEGQGRSATYEDRPDLARAAREGAYLNTDGQCIIPLMVGEAVYAFVDAELRVDALPAMLLQLLMLCRTAEHALSILAVTGDMPNPATWQRVLRNIAQILTLSHTPDTILSAMAEQLRQTLPCERITFWQYQPEDNTFKLNALSARLTAKSVPAGAECPAEGTPLHVAWYTGQPVLLGPGWSARFPSYPNADDSINALAVVPLIFELRCLGVLTLERFEPRPFTKHDADWLLLVASMVAAALENLEIHETLKVTQQRMLEDTKMRALGEMAAGIAHDFNNILMSLLCHVEMLGLASSLEQMRERLPKFTQAISDARNIVQRVSRFGGKQHAHPFVTITPAALLDEVHALLHPQLMAARITVETDLDPGTRVLGNPSELREVVTNLITNAMHAMPEGGTLTLACGHHESTAWCTVTDTGIGMLPAILSRACEPFFSTKSTMGSGLGLSVSYRIIHQHNGLLTLQSVEGEGTTVTIELPLHAPKPQPAAIEGDGLSVLLVEDNEEIAGMLQHLLTQLGYRVTHAPDHAAGMACCAEEHFAVIITDLTMPGGTGDTIAQAARRCQPGVPVVLLSGSLDLQETAEGLYDGIMQKPIALEDLRAMITQVLSRIPKESLTPDTPEWIG